MNEEETEGVSIVGDAVARELAGLRDLYAAAQDFDDEIAMMQLGARIKVLEGNYHE